MAAMAALSELYEECSDLQMDEAGGEGELPPMEVGGGGREAAPSRARRGPEEEGPMEQEAAAARGPAGAWADGREAPGEEPGEEPGRGAGCRASAALEEANKMFLRSPRAREAALDGGFPMHCEKTPFDQLAFIEELFSLMVVNRLTEELGCDEIVDRE